MLNTYIKTFICILITYSSFSQKNNIKPIITTYIDSIVKLGPHSNDTLKKIERKLLQYDSIIFAKELGYAYHEIGKLYFRNKSFKKAINITKKAVVLRQTAKDTLASHKSLNNLYFFYKEPSNKLAVLEQIIKDKALNIYTFRAYNNAARIYINRGDYHRALHYLSYIINSYQVHHSLKDLFLRAQIGSIRIYASLKIKPNQLYIIENYHNKIKKHSDEIPEKDVAINNNNLASIYEDLGLNNKAILYYNKALQYYLKTKNNEKIGGLYNNLGAIYFKLKNPKKASQYFNKALKTTKNIEVLNYIYHNKGFYLQTNNSIEKIPYYQKSIKYLLGDKYQYSSSNSLPSLATIKKSKYALDILEDLIQIANIWVLSYKENNESSKLLNAKNTIHLIDELISYIRFEISIEKSKLFWTNKGVDSYMLGVEVSYLLNDIGSALYFMEKNKALLLLENLNNTKAQEPTIVSLDSIQKKYVTKTSNFIEYIINENEGYGIFCSNTSTEFFEIKNVPELLQQVKTFKKQCKKPFKKKEDDTKYAKNAKAIFQKLFPFKNSLEKITNKKLIIVSDYTIKNIPFEALTPTNKGTHIKDSYLINYSEISYAYSASVLAQIQKKEYNSKYTILGIAPETFATDSLIPLKKSVQDIHKIASLFSATLLEKEAATKEEVLTAMNDYKIIHFNTHAGIDKLTNEPWIALYDQKISLQELYNQPIQADLVVLDACKSAEGKLEIGEGIMSLSRGFTYNGAKSVIASQWNANEKALSTIFEIFYKELQKGTSKSKALHLAKLSYLNRHQLSEISPYYWASMILSGDAGNIKIKQNSYTWLVILGIGVLILSYFLHTKK